MDKLKQQLRQRTQKDLSFMTIGVLLSFILFSQFDALEWMYHFSREDEGIELDELIPSAIVLCVLFAFFSYRRWQDTLKLSLYCEELSLTDPINNLPNKRALERFIHSYIIEKKQSVDVLVIDIKGLEAINTYYGLSVQEQVFLELLYKFSAPLEDHQIIGYWQTGQFMVISPQCGKKPIKEVTRQIKEIKIERQLPLLESLKINTVEETLSSLEELEQLPETIENQMYIKINNPDSELKSA